MDSTFSTPQTIIVASDHAGFLLKQSCATVLRQLGYTVVDMGCYAEDDKVDYPKISEAVALKMQADGIQCALITCGSGVGVAIAANRFPWVRAVHAHDETLARLSREHNNANVLCMGGRFVAPAQGEVILRSWLKAQFEGERHVPRVQQLESISPVFAQPS
jgi:ribose 5-phosphate isomerase B